MASSARRLPWLFRPTIPETPIYGRTPIGRSWTLELASSRQFTVGAVQKKAAEKGAVTKTWNTRVYNVERTRAASSGARYGTRGKAKRSNAAPLIGVVAAVSAVTYVANAVSVASKQAVEERDDKSVQVHSESGDDDDDEGPHGKIRLAEVTKHDRDSDTKWIIRGTSVYDITDFVDQHPGGQVILRACGGSIDPYWKIFSIHERPDVYDILKEFHIGEIDDQDLGEDGKINWSVLGDAAEKFAVDDPFKYDPERDPNLIVRTAKPCNAETPGKLLDSFITPVRLFFVRNHLWVPRTHEAPQSVTIELSDGEEKTYTVEDLKKKFKHHTITATLQCAGNRRSHMSKASQGPASGLQWDIGAISTAEFTGVRLRDVLRDSGCGVEDDLPSPHQCDDEDADKHVHFSSPSDTYAASIPLQTALNPQADVLIAWDMNGEPLNRDHGGPLRALVPGTTAARSVKWLGNIVIDTDESTSQWQRRDYKCFGPNVKQKDAHPDVWDNTQAIQETPVQSAITDIIKSKDGEKLTTRGFAFSGGGRSIIRVDVSADGGKTWKQAELQRDKAKGSRRWAWTFWSADWPSDVLQKGQENEFVVKAVDDAYNTQPETFDGIWNFRGCLANAWHSVRYQSQ